MHSPLAPLHFGISALWSQPLLRVGAWTYNVPHTSSRSVWGSLCWSYLKCLEVQYVQYHILTKTVAKPAFQHPKCTFSYARSFNKMYWSFTWYSNTTRVYCKACLKSWVAKWWTKVKLVAGTEMSKFSYGDLDPWLNEFKRNHKQAL